MRNIYFLGEQLSDSEKGFANWSSWFLENKNINFRFNGLKNVGLCRESSTF